MWRFWWWRNIFLIISWFLFRMKRKEIFSQHDGMIPIWIDDGTKNKWSTKVNFMDFSFTYKKVQRIKMTKNSITFSKNIYTFPEFKIVLLHEIIMVIFMKWRYWNGFFTILAKWSIFYNWQAVNFSISNCNDPICFQVGPNILPANWAPNSWSSFRTSASSLFVYSHHALNFFTWL